MTQEQIIGIALGIAFIVYIIVSIFGNKLKRQSWQIRFKEKAKANNCITTGYCIKHKQRPNLLAPITESGGIDYHNFIVKAKYRYTVDDKDYDTTVKYSYQIRYENQINIKNDLPSVPQQVNIYYDKINPKKAYSEYELSDIKAGSSSVLLFLFMPLVIGIIIYFLLSTLFM